MINLPFSLVVIIIIIISNNIVVTMTSNTDEKAAADATASGLRSEHEYWQSKYRHVVTLNSLVVIIYRW